MRKEIERLGHYHRPSRDKIGSLLRLGYPTKLPSAKGFRRKEFASSLPPLMTIQINNLCNLRCSQCWERGDNGGYKEVEHKTLKNEMSTEQWEMVMPNGDVVGCPLLSEAKMGNVREQKFTEI
jgi:MoaA/NifB/PqqE/SkfB family radical SAM enzyme